jgi:hypothetical protein
MSIAPPLRLNKSTVDAPAPRDREYVAVERGDIGGPPSQAPSCRRPGVQQAQALCMDVVTRPIVPLSSPAALTRHVRGRCGLGAGDAL